MKQPYALVAELADALDSGSSDRKVVEVQVLSGAPNDANLNRQTVYFLNGLFVAFSFVKAKRAEE